jgi:hypothetical protein
LEKAIGTELVFRVTGSLAGVVNGTEVYTSDSVLAVAAVHAGVRRSGKTAVVCVRIVPVLPCYQVTIRNGVTSMTWVKPWTGACCIERHQFYLEA